MARRYPKDIYLVLAFLGLAENISKAATCDRANVGCVLTTVDMRRVVGYGFNGAASGEGHNCIRDMPGKCGCIHAETNAVVHAPPGEKLAFITIPPCEICAGLLINAGVRQVFYGGEAHRNYNNEGENRLSNANIWHGTFKDYVNDFYPQYNNNLNDIDWPVDLL